MSQNYEKSLEMLFSYEDSLAVDPLYYSEILRYAFEREDIKNIKRLLHRMIKDGGLNTDPLMYKLQGERILYYEINRLKLRDFCIEEYHKYHADYINSHPEYLAWMRLENKYSAASKVMTVMRSINSDSTNNNCREITLERLSDMADDIYDNIELFCKMTDNFPNSFDHGLYTSGKIGMILMGYAQTTENMIKIRDLALDYGLKAYRSGKIDNDIFHLIDRWQNDLNGTQYFGYLQGVYIVQDEKTGLHQRTLFYGIDGRGVEIVIFIIYVFSSASCFKKIE